MPDIERNVDVKKKKLNGNQGFSLPELLVAVAILAIVAIPFLHSFSTAARTNAKAKKVMDASTAAKNVFEELKMESVDDYISSHTILSQDNKTDKNGNPYTVYTLDASPVTANKRTFLAKVTLDPEPYVTEVGTTGDVTDYNSLYFSGISSLSQANNAFYIQDEMDDMDAAMALDPINYDIVIDQFERTITIDIDHDASTGESKVYATVEYEYAGNTYKTIDHYEIYSNSTELTNVLTNVFVCYLPMYNGNRLNPAETIVINNPTNYEIGVYLVKQTTRDSSSNYMLKKTTNPYAVDVVVNEGTHNFAEAITTLTTNLVYSAGVNNEINVTFSGINNATGKTVKELFNLSDDLRRAGASIHIYQVKIEIYDKDSTGGYGELLTEMEGTKTE